MLGQAGLFDVDERLKRLSDLGDPAANTLSDERTEFLINDRLSSMRFLGLSLSDRAPDARTIWLFREKLTRAEAIKPLFDRFDAPLREAGYVAMGGQIVDASQIAAPKQHNTEEEKKAVKEGRIPEEWKAKPAKLLHKDRDARWTVKFSKALRPKNETARSRTTFPISNRRGMLHFASELRAVSRRGKRRARSK